MKIAVIGAGFTGLAAAFDLAKAGHEVTVFEKQSKPGGLASGFYAPGRGWSWPVEEHYHHVFKTDKFLKQWLDEFSLSDQVYFQTTKSVTLTPNGDLAQLDSPLSLLRYPHLNWVSKMRTALTLAFLKVWPWGQVLERWTAENFLQVTMGQAAWQELWQPLFVGKFEQRASQINAAWFWARIRARSKRLGYFQKGFLGLAEKIVNKLSQQGVNFVFDCQVKSIEQPQQTNSGLILKFESSSHVSQSLTFDRVLFTGSSKALSRLGQNCLPADYWQYLNKLESLAAITLILVLNQPFFADDTYWVNINQADWPFLAVVEHTNLVQHKHYNNDHIVYLAQYLEKDSSFYALDKKQILEQYQPFLNKLSPGCINNLRASYVFKVDVAQPLAYVNHSHSLPLVFTPLPQLFWAGMQHVYPYDRGVNYAIQLGRETAQAILQSA
jgi:protoporphyrinogen oxidase